jgi:single-strand DNA-binding protein
MSSISYNKVILVGRPTKNAEYDETYNRSRFSLAVSRNDKNKNTDFIPIVAWDKLADVVKQHVTKGKLLLVEGELHIDKYQSNIGENKYFTSVKMTKLKFLESKKSQQSQQPTNIPEYDEETIRLATEQILKKLSDKKIQKENDIFEDNNKVIHSNNIEVEYSDDDEVPF